MRVTAERYIVLNANWKRGFLSLGDYCHALSQLQIGKRTYVASVDRCRATRRVGSPQQSPNNRALTRSIGSGKRRQLTTRADEAHSIHGIELCAWILHDKVSDGDHEIRRSCIRRKGTPSNAVIAPSGSSVGAATVRAAKSAATTSVAPPRPAASTSGRGARRPSPLALCGTTSRTNPIS